MDHLKTITEGYENLSNRKILEISKENSLIKFVLDDASEYKKFLYCRIYTIDKKIYFLPLVDPELEENLKFNDPQFKKKSNDYALLSACDSSSLELFLTAIAQGANVNAIDYTDTSALFSIQKDDTEFSLETVISTGVIPKNLRLKLTNKFFVGEQNFETSALLYARKAKAFEIVQKLIEHGANLHNEQIFKKVMDDEITDLIQTNEKILNAQKNLDIPIFQIYKKSEQDLASIKNLKIKDFTSPFDTTLHIKCFFNKNFFYLEQQKEASGKIFPNITILAQIYAFSLIWNKNGEKISDFYHQWAGYTLFRELVFHNIIKELHVESYKYNEAIFPEHLVAFVKQILYQPKFSSAEGYFCDQTIYLLYFLFKYFFVISTYHPEWKKYYSELQDFFVANTAGNFLLKIFCSRDKIFESSIKPAIQYYILRKYLATTLVRGIPSLSIDITTKITEFWQPCEIFIQAIRNLSDN